jgi:hypothetical protein
MNDELVLSVVDILGLFAPGPLTCCQLHITVDSVVLQRQEAFFGLFNQPKLLQFAYKMSFFPYFDLIGCCTGGFEKLVTQMNFFLNTFSALPTCIRYICHLRHHLSH